MKKLVPSVSEADPGTNVLFRAWQDKLHKAIENTNARLGLQGVLIEVAAQHPLTSGRYPNAEFAARLDAAKNLYCEIQKKDEPVKIYVPGSLHKHNGVVDFLSLSEAGCLYLQDKGIPSEDLFGVEKNDEYKGESGVYNSSDECFVATALLKELGYREIHSVCSPAQLHRKALSYIAFGLVPQMHSVPVENLFHSYVDEAFLYIPRLLQEDDALQGESAEAERLRHLRKPE